MPINFVRFRHTQSYFRLAIGIAMLCVVALSGCQRLQKTIMTEDDTDVPQEVVTILGGTPGGSFAPFAAAVKDIVTPHESQLVIAVKSSPGSVANTRSVNENWNYLGIAFASETYLGYHGQEVFAQEGPQTNIRAVTLLYMAYAQAAVLADSDIQQFEDLAGKKVASGEIGSGSAQTIERLATSAGIWDQITLLYKGSNEGAAALQAGEADVFQMLVGVPNDAMAQLAMTNEIRMLDMDTPAQASGFYGKYPFYQPGALPAGAYGGKVEPVNTLLMPTLLIAHKDTSAEVVYTILKRIYTAEGWQALQAATGGAAASMTVENAPNAFVIPLHSGAYQFWKEQGVSIPEAAMPEE